MMLTQRESAVLDLIVRGGTDREIAALLGVQPSTARKHRENLQAKLQVTKSAQLVSHYFRLHPEMLKKSR